MLLASLHKGDPVFRVAEGGLGCSSPQGPKKPSYDVIRARFDSVSKRYPFGTLRVILPVQGQLQELVAA